MSEAALALSEPSGGGPTKRRITVPRDEIPIDLLITHHDPKKFPRQTLATEADYIRVRRDADWASKREQLFAVAAAGLHLALFAWNLAFWGSEGMPPDRYWPANPRLRLGIRPGRYGNLQGAKKLWYYYLNRLEGGK